MAEQARPAAGASTNQGAADSSAPATDNPRPDAHQQGRPKPPTRAITQLRDDQQHRLRRRRLAWILLIGAIASEVVATSALKLSNGLTRPAPSVVVAVGYLLSFVLLAQALKLQLQVSVAYAIWSGVGTAAITIIGMLLLNEPLTVGKALGIALVIGGVVMLNLEGAH
jgi:small multidrug resistance pump